MKRADIKIGFSCNNLCKFCVQGEKRHLFGDKTTDEIKDILKKARQDAAGVVFTGGEPTIRPDLAELVSFAKKMDYKIIQIQTNGRMFVYKKYCMELIKAGATEFSPALHGHIAELHDYLTGVSGSFRQTAAGIKNLKELGQKIIVNSVITKSNYRHLDKIAELLVGLGVDQYQFAFAHALGSAEKNFYSIVPRKTLIEPYVKKGLNVGIKAGIRAMTEAIPYCFMKGYEACIAEKIIPDTKIYDRGAVIDFTKERLASGKSKGKPCLKCKVNNMCEGPWKEYPKHYGWNEFKSL